MNCNEFEDRLYDEDCRAALLGRAAEPPDVTDHIGRCTRCRASWGQAAADSERLSRALVLSPPATLRVAVRRALPAGHRGGVRIDWTAVTWAVTGGALGASLFGAAQPTWSPLWQWVGFWFGAGFGLVISALSGSSLLAVARASGCGLNAAIHGFRIFFRSLGTCRIG